MPLAHRILMSAALAEVDAKGNAQIRAAMSGFIDHGLPRPEKRRLSIGILISSWSRRGVKAAGSWRFVAISEASTRLVEVRKVGYSGVDLLRLSSSHFDPERTLTVRTKLDPGALALLMLTAKRKI
jgi:hypothetical protein